MNSESRSDRRDPVDTGAIRTHFEMLHQLAAACWDGGELVLFAVGEDPDTRRRKALTYSGSPSTM
jgi:hypothetical protein